MRGWQRLITFRPWSG